MNCSEFLVDYLIKCGVTDVFGYAGGYIVPFMDALYKQRNHEGNDAADKQNGNLAAAGDHTVQNVL